MHTLFLGPLLVYNYCIYEILIISTHESLVVISKSISNWLLIPLPNTKKIDVLVMEVLQQITNPIPITYKFLVITKTHLSLT